MLYSKLPNELRDHPLLNVMESSPEGMLHAGVAMFREVHQATGFQRDSPMVITTVKISFIQWQRRRMSKIRER